MVEVRKGLFLNPARTHNSDVVDQAGDCPTAECLFKRTRGLCGIGQVRADPISLAVDHGHVEALGAAAFDGGATDPASPSRDQDTVSPHRPSLANIGPPQKAALSTREH